MKTRKEELFDIFSKEHEIDYQVVLANLEAAKKDDKKALEKIFAEYEYYITAVAVKYSAGNYERMPDLFQEGQLGLYQGIMYPKVTEKNAIFVLAHSIHAAIRNAYNNVAVYETAQYHVPTKLIHTYNKLLTSYFSHYHLSPSDEFVMDTLGITQRTLEWLKKEVHVETEKLHLDSIPEKGISSMEGFIEVTDMIARCDSLTNFQRYIIEQLMQGKSQTAIAQSLQLRRQVINNHLNMLRNALTEMPKEEAKKEIRTVNKYGNVIIPQSIRQELNIQTGDTVILNLNKDCIVIKRISEKRELPKTYRLQPLSIRDIAISSYLKEILDPTDYSIYYDIYVSKIVYSDKQIMFKHHLSQLEYDQAIERICTEIKQIPEEFIQKIINELMMKKSTAEVFNLDLSPKRISEKRRSDFKLSKLNK